MPPALSLVLVPLVVLAVLFGAAVAGGPDEAQPHRYAGPTPVLIPAGHLQPEGGLALLGARDAFWWNPAAGLYEHVGALICQVPPGGPPCAPIPPESAGDPSYRVFCGGITLRDSFWQSELDTYVWMGYDRLGSTGPHGHGIWCEHPRPPTTGEVWHWPTH